MDDATNTSPISLWQRLAREWMLLLFALLVLVLAVLDPQPLNRYAAWLQIPTLAGLLGLLIATQGLLDSGIVQSVAATMAMRMHSVRGLGLLLISLSALLAMLLTNDVSLFLIVPLTVSTARVSNLPILRMVVLEALAVNAGSTLSPIGNPQNLLLWQHMGLPFLQFVADMLPVTAVMFVMLIGLTLRWLPGARITLKPAKTDAHAISARLAGVSVMSLLAIILLMEYQHVLLGAGLLLMTYGVFFRSTLMRVDGPLLLTFAMIFIGLGHFGELPVVAHALDRLDFSQPLTVYLTGILASQVISNVPATVLLLDRVPNLSLLAIAVNVGGFGVVTGSLANFIALRLAAQPNGMRQLHLVSIPYLLLCAPLTYLAWRWLG